MQYLSDYFSVEGILYLVDINPDITHLELSEIESFVLLLINYGIDENAVWEIIYANPFCLNRSVEDIQKLTDKLYELGIVDIATVFESNPWFLDKDVFEIDDHIQEKTNEGKTIECIIDELSMGII